MADDYMVKGTRRCIVINRKHIAARAQTSRNARAKEKERKRERERERERKKEGEKVGSGDRSR